VTPNSFIVLFMVIMRGVGLKFEHDLYNKWIFCVFLAVLPTWHKTNINLCRSHLVLREMTSLQLCSFSQRNILISVPPFRTLMFLLTSLLIKPNVHVSLLFCNIDNASFTSTSKVSFSRGLTVTLSISDILFW